MEREDVEVGHLPDEIRILICNFLIFRTMKKYFVPIEGMKS